MNDIVSLDSVRRAHQRSTARRAGADEVAAEPELEATHVGPSDEGGWYTPPASEPAAADAPARTPAAGPSPTAAPGARAAAAARASGPERGGRSRSSAHPAGRALRPAAVPTSPVLEPVPEYSSVVELPVVPELSDAERLAAISETVIRALGRRQLSVGEARELLVTQGAEIDEAETLVARYEELGYLNDQALAESLVERLSERNHKSRGVIARELSARKIPSDIVSTALEQLDDDHEFQLALDAATKRAGQLTSYDDQTAERRLLAFLSRRGFSSAVVREATRRALATRKSFGPRFR